MNGNGLDTHASFLTLNVGDWSQVSRSVDVVSFYPLAHSTGRHAVAVAA